MKKIVAIPCFIYIIAIVLMATSVKAQDNDYDFSLPWTIKDGFYTIQFNLMDTIDPNEPHDSISVALDTGRSNLMLLSTACDKCNAKYKKIDLSAIGWQPKTPGLNSLTLVIIIIV